MSFGAGGAGTGLIAEAGSQILGSVQGAAQARMADNRARKAASKARQWSERMRSTAYQTAVKDLELAGLNPLLAVSGHSPSPGHTPSSTPANVGRTGKSVDFSFQRAMSGAKQANALKDELRTIAAMREKAEVEASVTSNTQATREKQMETDLRRTISENKLLEAQTEQSRAMRRSVDLDVDLGSTRLPAARAAMRMDQSEFGETLRYMNRVMEALTPFKGMSRSGR